MNRKKLIIIHHCGTIGGSGRSLLQTVNMLSEKYDISVLCPADSQMSVFLTDNNIDVIPYSFRLGSLSYYSGGPDIFGRTFFKEILYILKNRRRRIELLKNCGADLIMINSVTESFIAKEIKKYTSSKCICFVRETLPHIKKGKNKGYGFFFNFLKRYMEKYCDGVFFISDFDRLSYNLSICNAVTVRNTVPDRYFDTYEDNKAEYLALLNVERTPLPEDYYILYLGGNSKLKGMSVICEAMQYLPSYVRLLYAGSHSKSHNIYTTKISGRIEQLGMLEDVIPAYRACDLVVFPATAPHQGRPIFEAGAFRKTVAAAEFDEIREDLQDGVNGATFQPGDAKELAMTVSDIMLGRYKGRTSDELAENNRAFSKANHSISAVKKSLLKGVEKAMSEQKIKFLHIMTASNYATVDGYTKLINNNFNNDEHFFIIRDTADNPEHSLEGYDNILWLPHAESDEAGVLFSYIDRAEHIFWHSMGWKWPTQWKMLKHPLYMKKSTWVEWGADLFDWRRTDGNPITRIIVNHIHKKWRSSVASVVAIFPTDEKVYRMQFSKKTPVMHATYSVYHHSQIDEQKPSGQPSGGTINILVGHSATPNCHHIEVLESLAHFKDDDIMLFIPLSYGDKEYAKTVMYKAKTIFGENKVHFITENMPLWDYVHFLWSIDIGIFKVYRQIALGNICRLLYMTKKVFLPAGSLLYDYYKENETEVYDCDKISDMTFEEFSKAPLSTEPSKCIKERMTQEKVIEQWANVFANSEE